MEVQVLVHVRGTARGTARSTVRYYVKNTEKLSKSSLDLTTNENITTY